MFVCSPAPASFLPFQHNAIFKTSCPAHSTAQRRNSEHATQNRHLYHCLTGITDAFDGDWVQSFGHVVAVQVAGHAACATARYNDFLGILESVVGLQIGNHGVYVALSAVVEKAAVGRTHRLFSVPGEAPALQRGIGEWRKEVEIRLRRRGSKSTNE